MTFIRVASWHNYYYLIYIRLNYVELYLSVIQCQLSSTMNCYYKVYYTHIELLCTAIWHIDQKRIQKFRSRIRYYIINVIYLQKIIKIIYLPTYNIKGIAVHDVFVVRFISISGGKLHNIHFAVSGFNFYCMNECIDKISKQPISIS